MIRLTFFLMFLCCAGLAQADDAAAPAWEGYWTPDPSWCARAGQPGEETPDRYGRDGLFGLEWSCDVTSAIALDRANSWQMQLSCLEMGDSYQESAVWTVTPQDRLQITTSEGRVLDYGRCADPGAADAPARLSCEAKGGTYQRGGILQQYTCFAPTPDAGQTCASASDCTGFCLAETRSCAPVKPMFGCHEILTNEGQVVGLCVD